MTESLLIAIIGLAGAVLAALIGAFGSIAAAEIKGKREGKSGDRGLGFSGVSCGLVGLVTSIMETLGLVLGVLFGASIVQTTGIAPQPSAAIPTASRPVVQSTPSAETSYAEYSRWVICWHGRSEHEYLIAYPETSARNGINLTSPMQRPWDGLMDDLTNDSIKMCLLDGTWYGKPNPEWFPHASHFLLEGNDIILCKNAPGCV